MPTQRGVLVLAGAGLAWLAGRVLAVPELFVVAAAAAVVVVAATAAVGLTGTSVAVRRQVSAERAQPGDRVEVTVELRNDGYVPTIPLLLEDRCPPLLLPAGGPAPRTLLPPVPYGATETLRYEVEPTVRGWWTVGPVSLRLRDPLGLAARNRRYQGTNALLVYPTLVPMSGAPPRGAHHGTGTSDQRRRFDAGDELHTMREYEPGEDLRRVHWPTTARRGRLMVRQNEASWQTQATVVLDTRLPAYPGGSALDSFERAVSAAASAIDALARQGYDVRLLLPSDTRPRPPAAVTAHLERLATVQPDREATTRPALDALRRSGAAGTIVAVMGTRRDIPVTDDPDLAMLRRIGRGFSTRLAFVGGYQPEHGVALLGGSGRWRVARLDDDLTEAWSALQRPTRARRVAR